MTSVPPVIAWVAVAQSVKTASPASFAPVTELAANPAIASIQASSVATQVVVTPAAPARPGGQESQYYRRTGRTDLYILLP